MTTRLLRISSWQETQANVRRAKRLAERYGLADAHPSDYIESISDQPPDFDDLLNQIK